MNISKKDINALNAELSITLTPADYETKVDNAIKKVQKQASMPGFRPGKVPVGLIKKQHGKSILVDEINKILNEALYNYINDNKIEILGNPMPKEDNKIDFDNQTEWTFNYELGLTPAFDVKLDNSQSFVYNTVKIDDELVEKYLKDVKRNYGKPSNPEVAEGKDVLYIDIVELDADNNIVAGGIFKSTSIGIDRLKNEATKAKLTGAKVEDKIVLNANNEAMYFSRSVIPAIKNKNEKEWHLNFQYQRHVGMYMYKSNILKQISSLKPTQLETVESLEQLRWLENGFKIKCVQTNFESHCVDTPEDLEKIIKMLSA